MKQEELATVGVDIDEKDYRSTIISSLPYSLTNFVLNQLAAAKLYSLTKTITPNALISLISKEYKHQQVQCSHQNGGNGKAKDQDCDEALSVMSSGKSNGKGKFERKLRGVCWNCGEKGHFKDKCLKPPADKKNDSSKSKDSTVNAMIGSDSVMDLPHIILFTCCLGLLPTMDYYIIFSSFSCHTYSAFDIHHSSSVVCDE